MTHTSNQVTIHGLVTEGPYMGASRSWTAAAWLRFYVEQGRPSTAIRRARDGEKEIEFKAQDGVIWHLMAA